MKRVADVSAHFYLQDFMLPHRIGAGRSQSRGYYRHLDVVLLPHYHGTP
jgi:hypothetical protein